MTKLRSLLGVLAFAALLFLPAINVHAQGAGNGDGPSVYLHQFPDGSTMAEFINLSSTQQELLMHDFYQLHIPVPLGLLADSIAGQHDGGYGDAEGIGTGPSVYIGSAGHEPDSEDYSYSDPGDAPDTDGDGGYVWDDEYGCLVYEY